ncbi:PepSY-associated TM helix domain-containing protein [Sessilibacter sp. MAH1]
MHTQVKQDSASKKSNYWISLGTLRQWHWISSAFCLIGMLLFAVTGITLNNARLVSAKPEIITIESELTPSLLDALLETHDGKLNPLPLRVRKWLERNYQLDIPLKDAEWDATEVYLGLPRPGGDAWLSIDLETGEFIYERTHRGTISFLNDLHKGRNTGSTWSWFLDIFASFCIIFSLSGLWLLVRYAKQRPSTWPLVTLGFVIPVVLILITIH